jgi:hypothetical protein
MHVPNAHSSIIEEEKIVGYLLNLAHPDGAPKARFFLGLGFQPEDWQVLANELRSLVNRESISATVESDYGQKYIVDGAIEAPAGGRAIVRTVWIRENKESNARLVTAYPSA